MAKQKVADGSRYERDFSMKPSERAVYGCTVTAVDLVTDERMTLARTGVTALDALRSIIADLDSLDGDWRIMSFSHPGTIERDLYAHRITINGERGLGQTSVQHLPEYAALKRINRVELLYETPYRTPVYAGPRLHS